MRPESIGAGNAFDLSFQLNAVRSRCRQRFVEPCTGIDGNVGNLGSERQPAVGDSSCQSLWNRVKKQKRVRLVHDQRLQIQRVGRFDALFPLTSEATFA